MIKMIKVNPYNRKLWIVWDTTEGDLRHALARENDDYNGAYKLGTDSEAITYTSPRGHVVMRFHSIPTDAALIAHEAFHAAVGILDRIGAKMVDESEECYAYLMDWIVGEIEAIKKETSCEVTPPAEAD